MHIQTSHNNYYSYLRQTNEIVQGVVNDDSYVWAFAPYKDFSAMPEVYMFIIALTEQCNLRCSYCCYSGEYAGNHRHSSLSLCEGDVDQIYSFIQRMTANKPIRICFYGGEPLTQYAMVQYAVERGKLLWGDRVTYSVSTNGTLLTEDRITWLVENGVEIAISIDGTESFHDRHRVDTNGCGSFRKVYHALSYLHAHVFEQEPKIVLLMTLPSVSDIETIAKEWQEDDLLRDYPPTYISGLTPNFSKGVAEEEWEELRSVYLHLIDVYQQHPNWVVLQTFFDEMIEIWKNRPIFKVDGETPMSTCMPVNTKLYIDSRMQIAVCEKINDQFRIGTIEHGIDWQKANNFSKTYYRKREKRCAQCPVVRFCGQCLTAMTYTDEQWDVLCHNERLSHRLGLFVFCEMAERGMLAPPKFPELRTERCVLNAIAESDIPKLRTIFADATTQRFLPELCDLTKTDDGIRRFLKSFSIYLGKHEGVLWGIRHNENLVGFVAIMDLSFNPTVFFAMHPNYRNQGMMIESVKMVTQYVCEAKLCSELHTEVDVENISSQRVLETCGYGHSRKNGVKRIYEFK